MTPKHTSTDVNVHAHAHTLGDVRVTLNLNSEDLKRVAAIARTEGRSLSYIVRRVLSSFLNRQK